MTDDLELRASDADRDRAAAVLGGALATGRLTSAEYAERLDSVYVAKTLGELVSLTRDLPADADQDRRGRAVRQGRRASRALRSGRPLAALDAAGGRCALTAGHLMFQRCSISLPRPALVIRVT
jgi:DUF1707 SHOCT-like domain